MSNAKQPQYESPYDHEASRIMRERLRDPFYLPTIQDVLTAFEVPLVQTEGYPPFSFDRFSKEYLAFEELEKEWWKYIRQDRQHQVFELFTAEYIARYTDYLIERIEEYQTKLQKNITIVEIGAGNGRLTYLIQERLKQLGKENYATFIATDNNEWGQHQDNSAFAVEKMDKLEAIEKYKLDIIMCSWMLYREDWTPDFRSAGVQEYILIGTTEDGPCGSDATWGINPNHIPGEPDDDYIPEYIQDGYERVNLDEEMGFQICRDMDLSDLYRRSGRSRTVSFRKTDHHPKAIFAAAQENN